MGEKDNLQQHEIDEDQIKKMKKYGQRLAAKAMFRKDDILVIIDRATIKCNNNYDQSFRNGVKKCHSCPLFQGGICVLRDDLLRDEGDDFDDE